MPDDVAILEAVLSEVDALLRSRPRGTTRSAPLDNRRDEGRSGRCAATSTPTHCGPSAGTSSKSLPRSRASRPKATRRIEARMGPIMTHVPRETVTCSSCGRTFDRVQQKAWTGLPLSPRLRQHARLAAWHLAILREMGIDRRPTAICGDCYKLFMDWLDQKPTN